MEVTRTDRVEGSDRVLVAGAGGFIGHHLVSLLKAKGYWVRGVDSRPPQYEASHADEFSILDLRSIDSCRAAVAGCSEVYQLAADMGGIGYISSVHASLTRNNALINVNLLDASREADVRKYLYTSSACVYPSFLQSSEGIRPLREADAIPADPEKGYGWEKLFTEQLATYYHEDYGLDTRIVRLHNIYGPLGAYEGGREKAPAALCRKVAESPDGSTIAVWGDGNQTRSFCYVDDCVDGLTRVMHSGDHNPVNLGTTELVTVRDLAQLIARIAGKHLDLSFDRKSPQGVRGRNSDNSRVRELLGWEPTIRLADGLARTYKWIWGQLDAKGRARPPVPQLSRNLETHSEGIPDMASALDP